VLMADVGVAHLEQGGGLGSATLTRG
jgi:hypothetical protein